MLIAFVLSSLAMVGVQGQTVNSDPALIVELPGSTEKKSVEIAGMLILNDPGNLSSYPTPWSKKPSAQSVLSKIKGPIYSEFQGAVDCKFDQKGNLNHCKPVGSEPNVIGYSKIMNFVIAKVKIPDDFVKLHYRDQLSLLFSVRVKDRSGQRGATRPCLPYFCFSN